MITAGQAGRSRVKRLGAALLIVLAGILITAAIGILAVRFGSNARIADRIGDLAPARFGLVLGTGRIRGAGEDSPVFLARVAAAAALIKAGQVKYLIASGYRVGRGRANGDYDEPEDVREALVALGVPDENIIIDARSYRTRDSILRLRCFTDDKRVIVVSQRAHVARALFIGRASGRQDTGLAAAEPPPDLAAEVNLFEIFADVLALADLVRLGEPSCGDH